MVIFETERHGSLRRKNARYQKKLGKEGIQRKFCSKMMMKKKKITMVMVMMMMMMIIRKFPPWHRK